MFLFFSPLVSRFHADVIIHVIFDATLVKRLKDRERRLHLHETLVSDHQHALGTHILTVLVLRQTENCKTVDPYSLTLVGSKTESVLYLYGR